MITMHHTYAFLVQRLKIDNYSVYVWIEVAELIISNR